MADLLAALALLTFAGVVGAGSGSDCAVCLFTGIRGSEPPQRKCPKG